MVFFTHKGIKEVSFSISLGLDFFVWLVFSAYEKTRERHKLGETWASRSFKEGFSSEKITEDYVKWLHKPLNQYP